MKLKHIAPIALALALSACTPSSLINRAVDKTVDSTVDSAANRVGEKIGDAVAASILAANPELMYAYSMSVFQLMFYQGGYYIVYGADFAPGQYAQYQADGVTEGSWYEKVLLSELEDGSQWWRVETLTKEENGEESRVIMESLFSAAQDDGSRRVLRMRALLPGDEEPREIPVTEKSSQQWRFHQQTKLTQESMEGMTVGDEKIETPAGSFDTKHIQHKYASESGVADWWLAETVPGGMVKYTRTYKQTDADDRVHTVTLVGTGSGKTESVLGVDLTKGALATEAPADETK